jgi:choline dehydrogenase
MTAGGRWAVRLGLGRRPAAVPGPGRPHRPARRTPPQPAASGGSSIRACAGRARRLLRRPPNMAGIPAVTDFNGGDNEGVGYFQVNQKAGRRWSAARGFLKPALTRPNLKLETGAQVDRVTSRNGRARASSGRQGRSRPSRRGPTARWCCRPGRWARRRSWSCPGSATAAGFRRSASRPPALPGVGENLQDHLQIRPYLRGHRRPTMNELYASLWRGP